MAAADSEYKAPTIAEIADTFEAFAYDDEQRGRKHLSVLVAEHIKNPTQPTDPEAIKSVMIAELAAFAEIIRARKKKDMIWPPSRDLRYGHHYVLHWIMARWFMNAKALADLPEWYQAECAHIKDSKDVLASMEETLARLKV